MDLKERRINGDGEVRESGSGDHSLPWTRVLTTSSGNVAIQPTTPATPPEMTSASQESDLVSGSLGDVGEKGLTSDRDEKYRHDSSYLKEG